MTKIYWQISIEPGKLTKEEISKIVRKYTAHIREELLRQGATPKSPGSLDIEE